MHDRRTALATALAASLGFAGAALAQSTAPGSTAPTPDRSGNPVVQGGAAVQPTPLGAGIGRRPTAEAVNPTPMLPGSVAGTAPGMGGAPGATAANPLPGGTLLGDGTIRENSAVTPGTAPATAAPGQPRQ